MDNDPYWYRISVIDQHFYMIGSSKYMHEGCHLYTNDGCGFLFGKQFSYIREHSYSLSAVRNQEASALG